MDRWCVYICLYIYICIHYLHKNGTQLFFSHQVFPSRWLTLFGAEVASKIATLSCLRRRHWIVFENIRMGLLCLSNILILVRYCNP